MIDTSLLLNAYSNGWFPMSEHRHDTTAQWYSAKKRGIIPVNEFRVSKNVMRLIRQNQYSVRTDTAFRAVMEACANREETWISDLIIDSFCKLHREGFAHSVEIWKEKTLVGGLYGVSLNGAFFGESMFRTQPEMDKMALWHCHNLLRKGGFVLWDTQFYTEHLAQFGCIEISDKKYAALLAKAMIVHAEWPELNS